ncbi:MAG: MHYT domain-containing protein [Comamonas sp.]
MYQTIVTSYSPIHVVLSLLCALMGAYTALACVYKLLAYRKAHITYRLNRVTGKNLDAAAELPSNHMYFLTLLVAGVAFGGLGVWAMHFIGTLAWQLPVEVNYSVQESVLSLLAAVAAATWGLGIVAANPGSKLRLVLAGAILGMGVSAMHYLGMNSMQFDGFFIWNWNLVLLSCAIAFFAATSALWLAFATTSNSARWTAAVLMGGAVGAMHYTGMAAAQVICTTAPELATVNSPLISMPQLPILLVMLIVVISFIIALDKVYSRKFQV